MGKTDDELAEINKRLAVSPLLNKSAVLTATEMGVKMHTMLDDENMVNKARDLRKKYSVIPEGTRMSWLHGDWEQDLGQLSPTQEHMNKVVDEMVHRNFRHLEERCITELMQDGVAFMHSHQAGKTHAAERMLYGQPVGKVITHMIKSEVLKHYAFPKEKRTDSIDAMQYAATSGRTVTGRQFKEPCPTMHHFPMKKKPEKKIVEMPSVKTTTEKDGRHTVSIHEGYQPMTPMEAEHLATDLNEHARKARAHNQGPTTPKLGDF